MLAEYEKPKFFFTLGAKFVLFGTRVYFSKKTGYFKRHSWGERDKEEKRTFWHPKKVAKGGGKFLFILAGKDFLSFAGKWGNKKREFQSVGVCVNFFFFYI